MAEDAKFDAWSAGQSYEHYMGRWSRAVAADYLEWLAPPANARWLEIGCGTGALTSAVLERCAPSSILATDPSEGFIAHAQNAVMDPRAAFKVAGADNLPADASSLDVVTSALAFNFFPDRPGALQEMRRILKPAGLVSFYVWDYPGGGIEFIDEFWSAAAALDPGAADMNEALRFPFCTPDALTALSQDAGLQDIAVAPIEVETAFPDFEAFWRPFTLGAGPAPGYCMSLSASDRDGLKSALRRRLGAHGPVKLNARAWAVRALS